MKILYLSVDRAFAIDDSHIVDARLGTTAACRSIQSADDVHGGDAAEPIRVEELAEADAEFGCADVAYRGVESGRGKRVE